MELKLTSGLCGAPASRLLIVPYGIETTFAHILSVFPVLLIVPYGIETVII